MTLAELLNAVARGDREAFHRLYVETSPKLMGVCLRILRDTAAAEEALQETYLSVWRQAAGFDAGRGAPMTWLALLARSRAIDRVRSGRRGDPLPIDAAEEVPDPAPGADAVAADEAEAQRLHACLAMLQPDDARLIRTAFFEGSTYAELAARAAEPLGTIKSRIRRALLKLRACLQ